MPKLFLVGIGKCKYLFSNVQMDGLEQHVLSSMQRDSAFLMFQVNFLQLNVKFIDKVPLPSFNSICNYSFL